MKWARIHDDGPVHVWPDQSGALWESLCGVRAERDMLHDGEERCILCRVMLGADVPVAVPASRWMT